MLASNVSCLRVNEKSRTRFYSMETQTNSDLGISSRSLVSLSSLKQICRDHRDDCG